jgi:hypothetical protein
MPEPLRLGAMEAVEKHFRETHKEAIIKPVESHTLNGQAARSLRSTQLVQAVRSLWDDQRRFPLQLATVLSQQFASHGLQFFKVNKTLTHVSVARPHYLDLDVVPVSEGVKKIVDFINSNPKTNRRKLVDALAPTPAPPPPPAVVPLAPVEPAPAAAEASAAPVGEAPSATESAPPAEGRPAEAVAPTAPPAPAAAPEAPQPTAEQTAVIADLHWLIHQGHVIEFANGMLETAKKPLPKPPPKEPKRAPVQTTLAAAEGTADTPVTAEGATPPAPMEASAAAEAEPTAAAVEPAAPVAEVVPGTAAPEAAPSTVEPVPNQPAATASEASAAPEPSVAAEPAPVEAPKPPEAATPPANEPASPQNPA